MGIIAVFSVMPRLPHTPDDASPAGPKVISPPPFAPEPFDVDIKLPRSEVIEPQLEDEIAWPALDDSSPKQPNHPAPTATATRPWQKWLLLGGSALGLLVIGGLLSWLVFRSPATKATANNNPTPTPTANPRSLLSNNQQVSIGVGTDFRPMAFTDPLTKDRAGYDIDLARAIADQLGVPAVFSDIDYHQFFGSDTIFHSNALTDGRVDLVIDAAVNNASRQQYYFFSDSYLSTGLVAVGTKTHATVTEASDLNSWRVAIPDRITVNGLPASLSDLEHPINADTAEDAAGMVLNGQAEVLLTDATNAHGLTSTHSQLKVLSNLLTNDNYGVVVSKDKPALRDAINSILTSLKKQGALSSLQQKWLQ